MNIKRYTNDEKPLFWLYVFGILVITVILLIIRIIFSTYNLKYFSQVQTLIDGRDVDFKILYDYMKNDIGSYYNQSSIGDVRPLYLYYWYYIFFPIYLIPLNISLYVWDALRLLACLYVARSIYDYSDKHTDILFFLGINGMGYFLEMYLNNTNWLIMLLLYESFNQVKKERMWLSGILFSIAMYKVIVIIFPLTLLISKRIKIKQLIYYIIPFSLLIIPYLIFPDYLTSMLYNWGYSESLIRLEVPFINLLYDYGWVVLQTAQLTFISLLGYIILVSLENRKKKNILFAVMGIYILSISIFFWIFSYHIAFS